MTERTNNSQHFQQKSFEMMSNHQKRRGCWVTHRDFCLKSRILADDVIKTCEWKCLSKKLDLNKKSRPRDAWRQEKREETDFYKRHLNLISLTFLWFERRLPERISFFTSRQWIYSSKYLLFISFCICNAYASSLRLKWNHRQEEFRGESSDWIYLLLSFRIMWVNISCWRANYFAGSNNI